MNASALHPRATCLRCRLALSSCWCAASTTQRTRAELILLQHPREARNPIGTARMAHLSVADSQIRIGIQFAEDPAVLAMLADPTRRSVVLYPSPNARPAEELQDSETPLRIFVLDGTWWQAKKLWQANPWLQALPAYRLTPQTAGQYRIRREPAAHCLATIEAVAQLLDVLDGQQGQHASLLEPFHVMVERQIAYAESAARAPRIRTRPRTLRICPPLAELQSVLPQLLLVHAEGNGWPVNRPGTVSAAGEVELMQWLAIRPSTGETFHALLQTQSRAPKALQLQALSEQQVAGAVPKEEFLSQWQKFTRADDAWCSWGYFPTSLLKQAGGEVPPFINLQSVCHDWFQRKMPQIEQALEALAIPNVPAQLPGRGGRRLAEMTAAVRALAAIPQGSAP